MVFFRNLFPPPYKTLVGLLLTAILFAGPAYALDTLDSQQFISGFNSYQNKDYKTAITTFTTVLKQYPTTELRDLTLYWLSFSHYKAGNLHESAEYMSQFLKEYPSSPLIKTADENILELADKLKRGESIPQHLASSTEEQERLAKAEQERLAKAEQERLAKAEQERLAKAEQERLAKAEQERLAKAEQERLAKAEQERLAKAEQERLAKAEQDRLAKAVPAQTAPAAIKEATKSAPVDPLREQAIAEYKAIIDRYPGTKAADNASARLKQIGIIYTSKQTIKTVTKTSPVASADSVNVLAVEVGQFTDLAFNLSAEQHTVNLGSRLSIPFDIVNRGNSADSFVFESGFPAGYDARFVNSASPNQPITRTPQLSPGEQFKGFVQLAMPTMSTDGERKIFPVKVLSETDRSVSQSRSVRLVASAPLLRTVIKSDVTQVKPGDTVSYRLVLLNVGSAPAKELTLRLTYPPQYEPVNPSAGFKANGSGTLELTGLSLVSGESKELPITMKLKDTALAREELFIRADILNTLLDRTDKFISAAVEVKAMSSVALATNADKVVAVPGQSVYLSLAITNTGNIRDSYKLRSLSPNNVGYTFYQDNNHDGQIQAGEAKVDQVGPLAPNEAAHVIVELASSPTERDGTSEPLLLSIESSHDPSIRASANLNLLYSRPVVNLSIASKSGKVKPGDISSVELSCVNIGSSMAKVVDISSRLTEQLEFIAAEPAVTRKGDGEYSWHFDELGAGEKRNIRISYRVKPGTPAGTSLEFKNALKYQDQIGNSY